MEEDSSLYTLQKKARTVPAMKFKDEGALLKFTFRTLVNAGMTVEQVEQLRLKSNEPGYIFSKEAIGQRRYATSELLAAGLSNKQIADALRLSKETVNSDRQYIRQVYTESILQNADNWRAKLIQEQGEIKEKAMESFEKSKTKTIVRVQERHGETVTVTEEQTTAGDAAFLNVAKSCLEQQAKILGLFDKQKSSDNAEKGYKAFLESLGKEVKKIGEAERNAKERASAIDTEATVKVEFDEDGEPIGDSRPLVPVVMEDEGNDEEG
jgi:predicted RNA-binding protein YlxR (DUF448 family)